MTKFYPHLFCLIFLSLFRTESVLAQCSTTPCDLPIPSVNAQNACILPNPAALDCYFGATTFDAPESWPPYWCTVIHNNHWFAFTADASTASFDICTYGCAQGNGIQAAILSTDDCINFEFQSVCIGDIPTGTCTTLSSNTLTPGEVYYICIDGSSGAVCDYSINGVNPTINGPTSNVCLPSASNSTYTTNTISNWTINPPSAGNILGPTTATSATVHWLEPGPAQVCAQSIVCPNAPDLCLDINIGEDVQTNEYVDVCQNHTVDCAGKTFSSAGNFPVHLHSFLGCDSTVNCIVHLIPTVTTTQNVHMCPGGSVTCAGEEFFGAGTFPVTLQAYQGCDSIVNCKVTVVPISNTPMKIINLCGPAQYEVCGQIFDQTGIYAQVCTGWLGCDSIVNVDLAIMEPHAAIAPPAILDCAANLTITLDGSGSSVNTAQAGVTLYHWSGPGIIGPNNQSKVKVNQPGDYCLIVEHGRGGVYCADTTCVHVNQDAGIPQLPTLTGLQTPCAGMTLTYTATATGNPPPTSYVWTLPGNHPFTAVPPSSISVTWAPNTPPGQMCVTANNSCGASPAACIPISVGEQPLLPQLLGPSAVCTGGGNYLFTLDTSQVNTTYIWTVPPGAVLSGSGDTVSINFASAASGQICVTAQNGCDTLAPVCKNVQVVTNPTADLSGIAGICAGDSLTLLFTLTGAGPFDVVWSNGAQQFTLNNINSGHQEVVHPAANTAYSLVSVTDNTAAACSTLLNDHVDVAVWPLANTPQTIQICEGQSVLLGGAQQNTSGVYRDTLNTIHGCDSVIVTTLIVNVIDTTVISLTTCDPAAAGTVSQTLAQANGCDSIVVTTTVLLPSDSTLIFDSSCDPNNVGVFTKHLTNVYGCDSTVVTTVIYSSSDTTYLAAKTCDPNGVGVFQQLLSAISDGCDSLVITTVTLSPSNTVNLSGQSCNPAQVGVFTNVLTNQYGCDSTIITTISFNGIPPTNLSGTTCNASQAGVFTNHITTASGCDSTVITTVTLIPLPPTPVSGTTCDPNAVGVFSDTLTTAAGCDSIIVTTVTLLPSSATSLSGQSCNPANVGVFVQHLTNHFGCDSTVTTTITFNGIPPTNLSATTCDPIQAGVFTNHITTAGGCDSTVITTVTLLPSSTTNLSGQSCNPANVGVFVQHLTNHFGCDSTVTTTITFNGIPPTNLTATTCDPTQAGVFTNHITTAGGCDSTVITTVTLLPSNTTSLQATTCDPAAAGVFVYPLANQYGCDSIVTKTVTLLPSDSTFIALGTCDLTQVGTVVAHLTNHYGCDSTVVTTTSLLPPASCGMTGALSGSTIPCGMTTGSLTLTVTLGEGPFTYTLLLNGAPVSTGTVAAVGVPQVVNNLAPGNYTVKYQSSNGFSATSQAVIIQLVPPQLNVSPSSAHAGYEVSCPGAKDGSALAGASGGLQPYQFSWSNGATGQEAEDLVAGTYTVVVTDANQCTATASVTLHEPMPLQLNFQVTDPKCFGNKNGSIVAVAGGGVPPYRFTLNGGDKQNSNVFSDLGAGSYTITAFDVNGCFTSEIIAVNSPIQLNVDLGQDIKIALGDTATLEAVVNVPYDSLASVIWTPMPDSSAECPQCLTQSVTPFISTTYVVEVVDNKGCRDDDKVTVIVDRRRHLYIPNIIYPASDNSNEKFSVFAKPGTVRKIRSMAIYDRWGEELYVAKDFQPGDSTGWDGSFKGEPLNPGVYVWVVEVEFVDGLIELYKGDVTLMR